VITDGYNLDDGQFVELPVPQPQDDKDASRYAWINDPMNQDWWGEHGVNLVNDNHGLIGVNIKKAVALDPYEWDERNLTADQLRQRLAESASDQNHVHWAFNELGTYGAQTPAGTLAILQVLEVRPSGDKIRYKLALSPTRGGGQTESNTESQPSPPLSASVSSFGPVMERTIETGDSPHRALNLASGDFVSPSRARPFVFRPAGAATLRVAVVDLYSSDDALAPDNINTLDMRLWLHLSQWRNSTTHQPVNIDEISADEFDQLLSHWSNSKNSIPIAGGLGGPTNYDLSSVEPVLRGTRPVSIHYPRRSARCVANHRRHRQSARREDSVQAYPTSRRSRIAGIGCLRPASRARPYHR